MKRTRSYNTNSAKRTKTTEVLPIEDESIDFINKIKQNYMNEALNMMNKINLTDKNNTSDIDELTNMVNKVTLDDPLIYEYNQKINNSKNFDEIKLLLWELIYKLIEKNNDYSTQINQYRDLLINTGKSQEDIQYDIDTKLNLLKNSTIRLSTKDIIINYMKHIYDIDITEECGDNVTCMIKYMTDYRDIDILVKEIMFREEEFINGVVANQPINESMAYIKDKIKLQMNVGNCLNFNEKSKKYLRDNITEISNIFQIDLTNWSTDKACILLENRLKIEDICHNNLYGLYNYLYNTLFKPSTTSFDKAKQNIENQLNLAYNKYINSISSPNELYMNILEDLKTYIRNKYGLCETDVVMQDEDEEDIIIDDEDEEMGEQLLNYMDNLDDVLTKIKKEFELPPEISELPESIQKLLNMYNITDFENYNENKINNIANDNHRNTLTKLFNIWLD